jgi:hypothetical protein
VVQQILLQKGRTNMTTQEMLEIILNKLKNDPKAEIVGTPRDVPHGGIAVDVRQCMDKKFQAVTYQVYGKAEVLAETEAILQDINLSAEPKSKFILAMNFGSKGRRLSGIASVKLFPNDEECRQHLLNMKSKIMRMGYFANFLLLNKDGGCEMINDLQSN